MDLSQMPNPLYPLAWLPPATAKQLEDVSFAEAAFLISTMVHSVAMVENCHALGLAEGWTGSLQYVFNALLFVFRIRGVFFHQRYIVWFFYFMWLAVFAACLVAPFGLDSVALPPSGLCVNTRLVNASAAGVITSAVNDTLIFVFITGKLVLQAHDDAGTAKSFFHIFFSGKGMGEISRVVLQTGQLYYLATAGFTIASAIAIFTPAVPAPYADVMIVVNGFITNVMTTRVYRLLKLRLIYDHDTLPHVQVSTLVLRVRSSFQADSINDVHSHPQDIHGYHMEKDVESGTASSYLSAKDHTTDSVPYPSGSETVTTSTRDGQKSADLHVTVEEANGGGYAV
ncbi:hypothetical protein EIP91_009237 [Steccherinum ochraceum]|uniref:Transmembrane protein n=1 Tax=Steccherinum ochraceum TaxID=92696 RepID=A0A4R0R1W8_9APHY|nr:hypothetical protein EIP91_009237 [Steccherinum ochraceum]